MHEIMRALANTISAEPVRLALLAMLDNTKGLTAEQHTRLAVARRDAPEPYRTIIDSVMRYRELQNESRIA